MRQPDRTTLRRHLKASSRRHGDHTSGLSYLLRVSPTIGIYVPAESFGPFGGTLPRGFYKSVDSLPHRYFDGEEPGAFSSGSAWPGANFVPIDTQIQVAPGIFLVPTVSKTPATLELRELTVALQTPHGLVLVVGCAHSGIEEILSASMSVGSQIHMVIGGLHLVKASDAEVDRLARALHDTWKLDRIAPGHCTGEPAFAKLSPNSAKSSVRPTATRVSAPFWRFEKPHSQSNGAA